MKTSNNYMKRFVKYIRRTYKNKLAAIAALALGIGIMKLTGEGTLFIVACIASIGLFFANGDLITWG